jgi:cell division protein FtsN
VAVPARAQETAVARAETLANGGKYTEARAVLGRWWQQEGERSRDHENRARGLLLRGRLAVDPTTASQDYLTIVLEHPRATQAPEALLRVGQHFLTIGDAQRSAMYLERLVSDYPDATQRPTALLFLARAQRAAGADAEACKAVKLAATPGSDAELSALVRIEESVSCRPVVATKPPASRASTKAPAPQPSAKAPQPSAKAPQPSAKAPTPQPAQARTVTSADTVPAEKKPQSAVSETGAFALQSGAFREMRGARDLATRLERAGYIARVVRTGGTLALVRVGRFRTTQAAVEVARRIRAEGFTAVVVDDAALEKPVPE